MRPQAYLYVVRVSGGWAACCQRCGVTISITTSKQRAYLHGADHTCPSAQEVVR